jgi:hypothetical protein
MASDTQVMQAPGMCVIVHKLRNTFPANPYPSLKISVPTPFSFGQDLSVAATVSITNFSDTVGGTAGFSASVNATSLEINNDKTDVVIDYSVGVDVAGTYIYELVFTVFVGQQPG